MNYNHQSEGNAEIKTKQVRRNCESSEFTETTK